MKSIFSAVLWLLTLTASHSANVKIPSQVSDYSIETFEPDQANYLDEEKHELTNDIVLELEVSILENNEVNENLLNGNETALSRPKRSLATATIAVKALSIGTTVMSVACRAAKTLHRYLLKQGVGVYGIYLNETRFYYEQAKMNKVKIICVKDHIEEKDSRLDAAFKTYERAQLRANFVKEEYENYLSTSVAFNTLFSRKGRKIDASSDIIEEITTCLYIEQGRAIELLSTEEFVVYAIEDAMDITKDIAFSVGVGAVVPAITSKILSVEWVAKNIGGTISDGITASVGILSDGVTIVRNIYRTVQCIRDHFQIHGQAKAQRDAAKLIYDKSKIALDQMKYFGKSMEEEIDRTNAQVDQLVQNTNIMLNELQAGCQTNNASIISDLEELKFFVEVLRRNLNMKVDIENEKQALEESVEEAVQEKKEEMEEDGEVMTQEQEEKYRQKKILRRSKRSFENVKLKNPMVDPDAILMAMRNTSDMFKFPNEKWSKWIIVKKDANCKCEDDDDKCMIEAKRSCLSNRCFGKSERTYDRCEKEKFHFFRKCRAKDQTLVGSCFNKQGVSVSTGDISGHYVSVGVNQKQCYEDCKSVPGSVGCQFLRKNCQRSDECRGECFVVLEEILSSDKMPDVVCYKFKEPTLGSPEMPFLRQIFDATEAMMNTGQKYDAVEYNKFHLMLLSGDRDLVESQNNAWKKMLEYSKGPNWGKNPSLYKESPHGTLNLNSSSYKIFEPCNFASNWAYYYLVSEIDKLTYLPMENPDAKRALVQASAGLAFSSSFFHGGHTEIGQILDNHLIKIFAFTIYQTHIKASQLDGNQQIYHLKSVGNRSMTGVQMAQSVTDMFRSVPLDEWEKNVKNMDIPDYEVSFSAYVLTVMEQLKSNEGFFGWASSMLIERIGLNEEDKKFLIGRFKTNLKQGIRNWNDENSNSFNSMPDVFNFATALLRSLAAFPYQETFKMNPDLLKFLNMLFTMVNSDAKKDMLKKPSQLTQSLNTLNYNLDRFSTFPQISHEDSKVSCRGGKVKGSRDVFPGISKCKQITSHSIWHAQSAKGILDMIKFLDEFIGKRTDMQLDTNFFDETQESAVKEIQKTTQSVVDKAQSLLPKGIPSPNSFLSFK